jgi:hypothetical protein
MKTKIVLAAFGILVIAFPNARGQGAKPTLDSRWADLASPDDAKATRALLALSATPKETTAYLKDHLRPVKADGKRVAALVKQLDSSNFAQRSRAMNELEYLGKYIKSDLEAALKKDPEVETRRRIQELIDKMPKEKKDAPPPPPFKGGRSVSVQNINGQIRIIIDGQVFDPSAAATPPPPPPGPPAGWVRAVRAVTLLEHLATPEAQAQLQAIAAGEADALPTIAARAALERLKKGE